MLGYRFYNPFRRRSRPENDIGKSAHALRALLKDPDDTAEAFRLIEHFPFLGAYLLDYQFQGTRLGRRLLEERPELLSRLLDRDWLRSLPKDSLGQAYLRFVEREGITADGLIEARSELDLPVFDDDWHFIDDRMRDQHDLWHAVLGYEGDIVGEAAILAFSLAQTGNGGLALLVGASLLKQGPFGAKHPAMKECRRVIGHAFLRGLRARWLPIQPWEELLSAPLSEVRERLRVAEPRHYLTAYARDLK